jgi:hypothetical protein
MGLFQKGLAEFLLGRRQGTWDSIGVFHAPPVRVFAPFRSGKKPPALAPASPIQEYK